jgi:tetratricopeptide (TPR) repeat protein
MSNWFLWLLLTWLTGSPLTALVVLLVLWWLGDRATFQLLPDPLRGLSRRGRIAALRRTLAENPHDRRARLELANLLLDARRPREAAEALAPSVEAGDDDVHTSFAMGAALARSGAWDRAEPFLAAARARDPGFRMGELDLELGRMRVRRGDAPGALEPLRRLVEARPGTVEGRYWLARALETCGDAAGAERARKEGWREYAVLPRFRRRQERPFAWRLRPSRPALVAVAVVLGLALLLRGVVLPALSDARRPAAGDSRGIEP